MTKKERLASSRLAIREIERFFLRELSESEEDEIAHARSLYRLCVGLRRGLDKWSLKGAETNGQ